MRLSPKVIITFFVVGMALIPAGLYLYWQANQTTDGLETKLSHATPFTDEYYALEGSLNWWRNATASTYLPVSILLIATGMIISAASSVFCVFRPLRSPPSNGGEIAEKDGWKSYDLADGSKIKVKMELLGAKRSTKFTEDGLPIYTVQVEPVVQVVSVPEELRKPETPTS